jgi:GDP-L-fucose synthase
MRRHGWVCVFVMNLPEEVITAEFTAYPNPLVNIGTGDDVTIRELRAVAELPVSGEGSFRPRQARWCSRKLLDVSGYRFGWRSRIDCGRTRVPTDGFVRMRPPYAVELHEESLALADRRRRFRSTSKDGPSRMTPGSGH